MNTAAPSSYWGVSRSWLSSRLATLRRGLRSGTPQLTVLCALFGGAVGLVVVILHNLVFALHVWAFGLEPGSHLSSSSQLDAYRTAVVLIGGGVLVGVLSVLVHRLRPREIVDPIEANAMEGGRMSLIDSLWLAAVTLLSNAGGTSIGMEAAYTQLGAGILSRLGQALRLRRGDLRAFVGAGAAAAIGAAFNAPLAGAFYAFELVLGIYTVRILAPVAAAAMAGALVVRLMIRVDPIFHINTSIAVDRLDYLIFAGLGAGAAVLAILTMRSVAWCELALHQARLPQWIRPAVGGLALALIAFIAPQALGSGQGALQDQLDHPSPLPVLAVLLAAKLAASAISLGAGFRGGLFSSSLLIGCLFGAVAAKVMGDLVPVTQGGEEAFMLVGMGAVAAGIIGAPITMVLLALEMTGSLPASLAVFVGVVVSSVIVRHTFGYSFSTWRFHLRGLPIRGAEDIGWLAELSVAKVMTRSLRTVPWGTPIGELKEILGSTSSKVVFVIDDEGQFRGRVDADTLDDLALVTQAPRARDLAQGNRQFLAADDNVRTALARFAEWMVEELPVVVSADDPRPIGLISEPHALRCYSKALEARAGHEIGIGAPLSLREGG